MLKFKDLCRANQNWLQSDLLVLYDGCLGDPDKFTRMTLNEALLFYGKYQVMWFDGFRVRLVKNGYGLSSKGDS